MREVVGAGLRGVHDRQAVRCALVGAGDVDTSPPVTVIRVAAEADARRSFARSGLFRAAQSPASGLWFGAQLRRRTSVPPSKPDGIFSWIAAQASAVPSSRDIVIVNGVKPPAWMLVDPAVRVGANGRLAPGHGWPSGPEVTLGSSRSSRAVVRRVRLSMA